MILTCLMMMALQGLAAGQITIPFSQPTGSISVSSVPHQTTVSLDNRQVGVTPTLLNSIAPGTHTVLLTAPGYIPYSQQVTVQVGSVAQVYAILIQKPENTPPTGPVKFSSSPAGASIYLDNRLIGVTPTTINGVSAGQHQVLLVKQGYDNYAGQLTVVNGIVTSFYAIMNTKPLTAPSTGSIRLSSTPSSSSIYLDNRLIGVTPITINGIAPGQHQVLIMKPGYIGVTRNVIVQENQVTTVSVVLPVNPLIYF